MAIKFLRRVWGNYSKLGRGRKKKQVWRRPTGRDNKMREKRRGYPAVVSLGYRTNKKVRNTIDEKTPKLIKNVKELEMIKKNEIVILGNVGKKKKIEIAKKAKEMKIEIHNLNIKKLLKKTTKVPEETTPKDVSVQGGHKSK